jgi:tetratricopeptide (TPR) repeat protein
LQLINYKFLIFIYLKKNKTTVPGIGLLGRFWKNLKIDSTILFVFTWLCNGFLFQPAKAQVNKNKSDQDNLREAENVFFDACRKEILEYPAEALDLFKKSCVLNPKNAAAFYKAAELLELEDKDEEALMYAEKSVDLETNNEYYWIQLARLREENGKWKEALKAYDYMIQHLEGGKKYHLSKAEIFRKQKLYKNALRELEKTEKEMGPGPELFESRIQLFLQEGNSGQAEEECRRWIKTFPESYEAKMNYARLLTDQKKFKEAKKELLEMLEGDEGFASAHLMLANIYLLEQDEVNADLEIEKAILSQELPIEAKIELVSGFLNGPRSEENEKKALKLSDLILKVHPDASGAWILKGDLLNKFGSKREARICYIRATAEDKGNIALWEQLVLLDLNLNEIDSLQKHTAGARELFPNIASFAFYNGLSNLILKRYEKSVESLEDARRLSVGQREMQLEVFTQLGDAYYNLKETEKSFAAYDEVLKLDSGNAHVLNNYAYFLSLEKTNLDKALKMSRRLVSMHPDDPTFLDTHAWVLYQKGDYAEALAVLEKAAGNSGSGTIWEHFGDALFKNGKTDKAIEAWKKARELNGGSQEQIDRKIKEKKLP